MSAWGDRKPAGPLQYPDGGRTSAGLTRSIPGPHSHGAASRSATGIGSRVTVNR
jgi:hypothetical protein